MPRKRHYTHHRRGTRTHRRRHYRIAARRKNELDKRVLIDTAITSIIVQQVPSLFNKFFLSSNPLTGYALQGVGAAAAWLGGQLLKRPDISSMGIGLVGADILNNLITPMITPSATTSDYSTTPLLKSYTDDSNAIGINTYKVAYN